MPPDKPLPYNDEFSSTEEYIEKLLNFIATSDVFQILCGGVHIVDFFTIGDGPFYSAIPETWRRFLLSCDAMQFVDLLARDSLEPGSFGGEIKPPQELLDYIRAIRTLALARHVVSGAAKDIPKLPRALLLGMKAKKIHEVVTFSNYVDTLSKDLNTKYGDSISHLVDFGSGQNYLGRVLASEPYNHHVVAVEGRDHNVAAAKWLDMSSGLVEKPKVMRNKKVWEQIRELEKSDDGRDPEALAQSIKELIGESGADFRDRSKLDMKYEGMKGKGFVSYISSKLDSGDLSDVIAEIQKQDTSEAEKQEAKLMAISIHSCGNLSHHGIRSLVMNPDIKAVAIVGCCYNLLTERLGPPTYKLPFLRPTLQAINGRLRRESEKQDPHGFPMSERLSKYNGHGIRLNITARMMACQALPNWSREESEGFFRRHFFRAVLQKMFLDRGVVRKIRHRDDDAGPGATSEEEADTESPFNLSTNPVAIGTLRKASYENFTSYVRGSIHKLSTSNEYKRYADVMAEKMSDLTDEEIEEYYERYLPRKKEMNIIWSLMAFSAMVVESVIVTDRWSYLKEQSDVVRDAWVEAVFDYKQSPRNLVVVGIKK